MSKKINKVKVGKDSVVIGNVSGDVGDGSVVIGPTDNRGNVILNQPMAIGRNAYAGPNSIAIGAGAGAAGADINSVFDRIGQTIEASGNEEHLNLYMELIRELSKPEKDKSKISELWGVLETLSTLAGVQNLILQASAFITAVLKSS